jgi:hypothetical protein
MSFVDSLPPSYSLLNQSYQPVAGGVPPGGVYFIVPGGMQLYQPTNYNIIYLNGTFTEPAALTLQTAVTQPLCSGQVGAVVLSAINGHAPYVFTGDVTSNLVQGTYHYTVTDANSCQATASVTIQAAPGSLGLTVTPVQPACGDQKGSVLLSGTGGTLPYHYSGAATTNLLAGSYAYTVTDGGGCIASGSCSITSPPPLILVTVSKSNVTCYGGKNGTASASASNGFAPYSYLWSNGKTTATVTGLVSNTYTVTVTDAHGCSRTASLFISESAKIVVSVTTTPGTAKANVTGGTPGYTYLWNNGQVTQTATGLIRGNPYTVTVTDIKGCKGVGTVYGARLSGGNGEASAFNTEIFPNPTFGNSVVMFAASESGEVTIDIYNINGSLITEAFKGPVTAGESYQLEIKSDVFDAGIYFIRLSDGSKTDIQKLVILKH